MDWERHGARWPNHESSRFIPCAPHRWHVQVAGTGPTLLLLHGAGGATQSWRHLLPLLARDWHVVAPDLPGQGFSKSGAQTRFGLDAMAEDLWTLCDHQGWHPTVIAGHSAGGAIALRMALTRSEGLSHLIGLNPALGTFSGAAEWLFPALAKVLSLTPFVPQLFAKLSGTPHRVAELLRATGSVIDEEGQALYRSLVSDPDHVNGTLAMMAQWRINPLIAALPDISVPTTFITGEKDTTVPPSVSREAAKAMIDARVVTLPGLGHLAHEEAAERIVEAINGALSELPSIQHQ